MLQTIKFRLLLGEETYEEKNWQNDELGFFGHLWTLFDQTPNEKAQRLKIWEIPQSIK